MHGSASRTEPARDLFGTPASVERIGPGAVVLRGFILDCAPALLAAIARMERRAPFRHLETPGGFRMSVAMSNCGAFGWVSDRKGYRYDPIDPESGRRWPAMPACFTQAATAAAVAAGYAEFRSDVCLINRYVPGARLSLHQDRDESDFSQPIVSFSLGLPATFLWGGTERRDRPARIVLEHGDAVVWGGEDRLRFHGVAPLAEGRHPLLGRRRLNLTFRRARP